jgi:hypothetical protein
MTAMGATGATGRTPGVGPTLSNDAIARGLAMRAAFHSEDLNEMNRLRTGAGLPSITNEDDLILLRAIAGLSVVGNEGPVKTS